MFLVSHYTHTHFIISQPTSQPTSSPTQCYCGPGGEAENYSEDTSCYAITSDCDCCAGGGLSLRKLAKTTRRDTLETRSMKAIQASKPTPAFVDRKLEDDDDVRVVYQCKGWPLSVSLLCWLLLVEISDHMTYFFKHITPLISQIPYSLIFLPHSGTLLPVWSY